MSTIALKNDIEYVIQNPNGSDRIVSGRTPTEALGISLRRGRYGLGKSWTLTRQPDGWILAIDKAGKTLDRRTVKLREKNYTRGMR